MKHLLILSTLLYSSLSFSQHLNRQIFHGFRLQPVELEGEMKMQVAQIGPQGTAGAAGLQNGDILLSINGLTISAFGDLGGLDVREGEDISYTVLRGESEMVLSGSGVALPMESGDSPRTEYFEVPFDGGYLRGIANLPEGDGPFPTIYFIQGYTCSSVESSWPGHPYRLLAKAFTEAGIAFVRVEKPGVGDSQGTRDCMETDFHYEVESFTAGAEFAKGFEWVDPNQFYIFGHSMGGYLAPIVAEEVETAGIIAYGTRHEPWREYFLQMWRFQLVRQGFTYREVESRMRDYYELAYHLFFEKMSPGDIAESYPTLIDEMEDGLAWEGGDIILFRNYEALQSVDDLPVVESWLNYEGRVLMFYGTADFEVCSDDSPKEIVRMINLQHPNHATYAEVEGADHAMFQVGSMEQAVNMSDAEIREARMGGIEMEIPERIINWMTEN